MKIFSNVKIESYVINVDTKMKVIINVNLWLRNGIVSLGYFSYIDINIVDINIFGTNG